MLLLSRMTRTSDKNSWHAYKQNVIMVKPGILVGSDYYFTLIKRKEERLHSGIHVIHLQISNIFTRETYNQVSQGHKEHVLKTFTALTKSVVVLVFRNYWNRRPNLFSWYNENGQVKIGKNW